MKNSIRNWLLREYLCGVNPEKVITYKDGVLRLAGRILTPQQAQILKEEAAYVKRTELWGVFQNTVADTAHKVIFEKSQNFEDVLNGKLMLYNLSVLQKIVDEVLKYEKPQNPPPKGV